MRVLLRKLRRSLSARGWGGTVVHACVAVRDAVAGSAAAKERDGGFRARETAFDRSLNVDTAGVSDLASLAFGNDDWVHGHRYQPCHPEKFRQMLAGANIDFSLFTFCDIGAGKGRALLLAAEYPFQRIVGIELSEALANVARDNVARANREHRQCDSIEVICTNALRFGFPLSNLVLYLFNPFDAAVMEPFLDALRRSLCECPRQIVVVYDHPWHRALLDTMPEFSLVVAEGGDNGFAIFSTTCPALVDRAGLRHTESCPSSPPVA